MKLSEIPKEELELMGYDDIALMILQESGKKMKLRDIFVKVCKVLGLPDSVVDEQLVDFFEQMSINKKFVMLQKGYWDLQTRHNLDIVIEDEEDEEEILDPESEDIDMDIDDIDSEEDDIFYDKDDETDDPDEDDLADLMVIDSDDEVNM